MTGIDPLDERCLHDLVAAAATAHPDRVAVVAGDDTLTYRELLTRSGRLARRLCGTGAARPAVGVLLPRSADFVVAALAALEAGGHYVPLDPDYPSERLRTMLTAAGDVVVVGTTALRCRLPDGFTGRFVATDTDPPPDEPDADPPACTHPDDLAYVMFTSGSTGTPKGVMITHRGVVRLVRPPGIVEVSTEDVVLHLSSVSFDATTFDLWSALTIGATLVVAPPGRPSGVDIAALVRRHRVSTMLLPTGLFHLMVDEQVSDLAGLRRLVVGGDVLSADHARRFLAAAPHCVLVNAYGPTEVTVATTVHTVSPDDDPIPIGRPMPRTSVCLLDEDLRPVRPGEVGQIYAGGRGLARGYVGDPAQTAARFVPDPEVPGARLYATGDLARHRSDGALEFLGRADDQVKKRGFRVEPSEVESALRADPAVRDAVVFADGASAETRRLIVVLAPAAGPPDSAFLNAARTRLRAWVPEHLVPDLWIVVNTVPLTLGGKVDRAALRRLVGADPTAARPETGGVGRVAAEEASLAAIWRDVLAVDRIDADDDFFELGGHSLLANKIVYQVRSRLGIDLPLQEVFDRPRFHDLVDALRQHGPVRPPDRRRRGPVVTRLGYYAALVVATLLWGVEIVVGKYAVGGIGAFTTLFIECGMAAGCLWPLLLWRGHRRVVPLKQFAFLGLLEPFACYGALNVGLLTASAADAALLLALLPVIVLILGIVFAGESVGWRGITGAIVSTVGAVFLTTVDITMVGGFGDLFVILATLSAAYAVLVVSRLSARASALEITAYQFGFGFAMTIPVIGMVWLTGLEQVPGWSDAPYVAAAAGVGLGAFALAYMAYNYAVAHVSVSVAGIALNLIPLFGVVSAVLLLGEAISPWQWFAGALLLGGLAFFPQVERETPAPVPAAKEAAS